ncbi:MAG: hypothetical protein ACTHU0_01420 [Kofleriaceae bacterium]
MPYDLKFDPLTLDEIDDGHGSPVLTDKADTMVMHQLVCHGGACWQGAYLGSRLHDLEYLQSDPEVLTEEELRLALGIIEARGRIADLEVEAAATRGRIEAATRFRDVSTNDVITMKVPAGGLR